MTEITAQSAGVANMLLSKWTVVAFSIRDKARPHSRTFRILRSLSRAAFVDHTHTHTKRTLFCFCRLELSWGSSTLDLKCTVLPWISLLASVDTGNVCKPNGFFYAVLTDLMNLCFSSFHNVGAIHDFNYTHLSPVQRLICCSLLWLQCIPE